METSGVPGGESASSSVPYDPPAPHESEIQDNQQTEKEDNDIHGKSDNEDDGKKEDEEDEYDKDYDYGEDDDEYSAIGFSEDEMDGIHYQWTGSTAIACFLVLVLMTTDVAVLLELLMEKFSEHPFSTFLLVICLYFCVSTIPATLVLAIVWWYCSYTTVSQQPPRSTVAIGIIGTLVGYGFIYGLLFRKWSTMFLQQELNDNGKVDAARRCAGPSVYPLLLAVLQMCNHSARA